MFITNILTDSIMWAVGFPFLVGAELTAMCIWNKWTGMYKTQKATLEVLSRLAKKRGYKRIAKQAIQAIQETSPVESSHV